MANRYEVIWKKIKEAYEKDKAKGSVRLRCRPAKMATIILAVKKIKSAENRSRIALELERYGKLVIGRETVNNSTGVLTFRLTDAELAGRL